MNNSMHDTSDSLDALLTQRPESLHELVANMTPGMHARLREVVELGKWPDGSRLEAAQTERCLQALILYEEHHLPAAERTLNSVPRGCGANPAGVQSFNPAGESS